MKKKTEQADRTHPAFKNKNADPFYNIVMEGLADEVDGEHFWDAVAEDAVFEFLYNFEGFPNRLEGRKNYMDWFSGYGNILHSADGLRMYKSADPAHVIILEYAVHGHVPSTKKEYHNRFCSIITIKDRKIIHWRDYMDSLAVVLSSSRD